MNQTLREPTREMAAAFQKAHDAHAAAKIPKIYAKGQREEANVIVGLRAALALTPALEGPVGAMDVSAPPKVWLQIDTDGDAEDRSDPIPRAAWENLSWYYEPIGGQEVAYIRADLAYAAPAQQAVDDAMVERAGIYTTQANLPITYDELRGILTAALKPAPPEQGEGL